MIHFFYRYTFNKADGTINYQEHGFKAFYFVLPTSAAAAKRCCCSLDMRPQWQRCQSVQLTQPLFKKHIPDHSKQKTELSKLQSTDLNAIQNLISDCVSFSILLARTGVLRAHHSYLVPSSIVIPNVGWISAAFIKFSSVIPSGNSSIVSQRNTEDCLSRLFTQPNACCIDSE